MRAEFGRDELVAVLGYYDLGPVMRIDPLLKGSRRSPKLILTTDRGRFLLKRRAPGRDDRFKVAFSHAVQQNLAAHGFPLPRLLTTRTDGNTLVAHEGAVYEVFEFLDGRPFDGSAECTADAGRVLATFHRLLEHFPIEWEPPRTGYHDCMAVRASLNGIPAAIGKHDSVAGRETELLSTVTRLFDTYDAAAEAVDRLGYGRWPRQIVHSDWHPGNMLFAAGRVAGVIDYDSLRWLPRVTDVANGLLQFSIVGGAHDPARWPAAPDQLRLRRFLDAYDELAPLTEPEVQALPHLMIEALIAEAVLPIAATGSFGRMEGYRFLRMVQEKTAWFQRHGGEVVTCARRDPEPRTL